MRSAQDYVADIGASTGGFCDVLLRDAARSSPDVGHGQWIRKSHDDRIIEMSGVNIRDVYAEVCRIVEMIVSDVSFISRHVIPVIAESRTAAQIVLLVKPQFEVGKGNLGKNGIVESQELREQALSSVVACAERNGLDVRATTVSPIEGTHGNIEYLLYAVMQ
ncbi:MAG: SAM-dependent methyltransferase [Bifidobacterium pseudocatenulatum]